jgi:selenium metabolism protein YedF
MVMKRIDCCGLTCPKPVLAVKDLIASQPYDTVQVCVDNEAAKQNVSRFLQSQGWDVKAECEGEGRFVVTGSPGACVLETAVAEERVPDSQRIMIIIPTDLFGHGDDELGRALMKNFVNTLKEMEGDLWRIVLVNNGVRLAVKGSEHVEELKRLAASGVSILVCGTCLQFFGLLEKKVVGETTNMLDIVTSCQFATKVIRI